MGVIYCIVGSMGVPGERGVTGERGPVGVRGEMGLEGRDGPQGAQVTSYYYCILPYRLITTVNSQINSYSPKKSLLPYFYK